MILTLTMNPSIDMSYPIEHLEIDDVNRVSKVSKTAGGKGLNVSRVIRLMGRDLLASGYNGGNFGAFLEAKLDEDDIKHDFVQIDAEIRNSIALLHDDGKQTEILEPGPEINIDDRQKFLDHFEQIVKNYKVVTMSGSLPKGLESSFYSELVKIANNYGVKVLLDTSGASLEAGLKSEAKPYLIKPNETEIAQLLDIDRPSGDIDYTALKNNLMNPIFDGVQWIVVSLGAAGAFVKAGDKFYKGLIPKINVVNPVGSGDSTLGGLAIGISEESTIEDTIKTAMTTGMLNTMSPKTGFVDKSLFDEYFAKVVVEEF
ncbi:tagatose-6-phosphate kinase [Companilactobacillus sp. RD055328]|uniref:hexose kinase n=1 Tax=Companilactobacillus sp. RD055328 TaxID=2916634 RepID=UPI001FC89AE7|nr:hexose kinase [Companilactobacillus sp. RD055328]GKQ43282.1 tagatose-6-phosphate kinase [Companilactobacillus sp. RD055328]